jgi:AcrR family transcriptional regulator
MTSRPLSTANEKRATAKPKPVPAKRPALAAPNGKPAPARRNPATERRSEIVRAASVLALAEGLESLTLRRVADVLGVVPGLVNHYFRSVEDLVAEAFAAAAHGELSTLFDEVDEAETPLDRMRALIALLMSDERDDISLLWIDAWNASRRSPALHAEVSRLMLVWQERVADLISAGVADGVFRAADPAAAAIRIMAVSDAFSLQAAVRSPVDYIVVRQMVIDGAERELDLRPGELDASPS